MNEKKKREKTNYSGSSFDSFQDEEGIREEVEAAAIKRVLAWQFEVVVWKKQKTNQVMAKRLRTGKTKHG